VKHHYDWTRYWYPRGVALELTDEGYLPDPALLAEAFTNRDVRSLRGLSEKACAILLGEVGSGRSIALEDDRTSMNADADGVGTARLLDLAKIASQDVLRQEIADALSVSPAEEGVQYVLIDGVDECPLPIAVVRADLIRELRKKVAASEGAGSVRVRITCRTAEWPRAFEDDLISVFGREAVAAYEIAPLTRRDVETAAHANAVEPTAFLQSIADSFAAPFAIRPVTLEFLLGYARRGERLPSTRQQLYEEGCLELCTETRGAEASTLSARERLAIARRIAALSIVTGRPTLLRRAAGEHPEAGDLEIDAIADDTTEPVRGAGSVAVTHANVEDTLRHTTLFSAASDTGRLRWSHRSYVEYLAATWFVESHVFAWQQLVPIVTDPMDPKGSLVPQLHGFTAWLAAVNREAFEHVLEVEPLLLVSSDSIELRGDDALRVAERLVALARDGTLPKRDPLTSRMLRKLRHPKLAALLLSALAGPEEDVRDIALEIALRAHVEDVGAAIVSIALDANEPAHLRVYGARVAGQIAPADERARLRPLLDLPPDEDPLDELRGYALIALWPGQLSPAELLAALRPQQKPDFFGAYTSFLRYRAGLHWTASTISIALAWIANVHEKSAPNELLTGRVAALETFADDIVIRAWDLLADDPTLLPAYAAAVLPRLLRLGAIVSDEATLLLAERMRKNPARRRDLVGALLDLRNDGSLRARLTIGHDRLLTTDDLAWLAERIGRTDDAEKQAALLDLMKITTSYGISVPVLDELYRLAQQSKPIASTYSWLFEGIKTDSSFADECRKLHAETVAHEAAKALKDVDRARRAALLPDALTESEVGNAAAFGKVLAALLANETDKTTHLFEIDVRRTSAWRAADATLRTRIVHAAQRFLTATTPDTRDWFTGPRALILLVLEVPEPLLLLAPEIWERWMPTVIKAPIIRGGEDLKSPVLKLLYRISPLVFLDAVVQRMKEEDAAGESLAILGDLNELWDTAVSERFASLLTAHELSTRSEIALVKAMLRHDPPAGSAAAEKMLNEAADTDTRRMIAAAIWLVPTTEIWETLWHQLADDNAFAESVALDVAGANDLPDALYLKRLNERQLADLHLWLQAHFPRAADPPPTAGFGPPREHLGPMRDAIIQSLAFRGTVAACDELRRIAAAVPNTPDIGAWIRSAESARRVVGWQPLQPRDVLRLAAEKTTRVVRNAEQLLQVVLDLLRGLEEHFRGPHSPVLAIWNENKEDKRKVFEPKDEDAFARRVAEHLQTVAGGTRLIVNREVKIREGQFTDIIVDALTSGGTEQLSVIIECKGCWHAEVRTAMETQLVGTYMRDLGVGHGIYLVGWFHCERWADAAEHVRPSACPGNRATLLQVLNDQAVSIPVNLTVRAVVMDCTIPDRPRKTEAETEG